MRVLTLDREIKDLTSLLDRLEGEKRESEKQAMTSGHLLQQLDSEMAQGFASGPSLAAAKLQRLASERAEQEGLIAARQAEIASAEQRRDELEQQSASAQEQLGGLRSARDAAAQESSQMHGASRHPRRTAALGSGRAAPDRDPGQRNRPAGGAVAGSQIESSFSETAAAGA